MPPSIGSLRYRLRLQSRSTAQDTSGGQVNTWSDIATVWGDIQPLTGAKQVSAQAVHAEVTHHVFIRWQPQFANPQAVAAMRLVFNGRYFNIHAAINEGEGNRFLTLLTSEGLNDG